MEVKAMQRSRPLTALVRLPALARAGEGRAARRYLRERTKAFAPERPAGVTPPQRPDGVRELTVTSVQRPRRDRCSRGAYAPWLRLAGRWLEEHGVGIHARVIVKVEPGRLIVTLKSEE